MRLESWSFPSPAQRTGSPIELRFERGDETMHPRLFRLIETHQRIYAGLRTSPSGLDTPSADAIEAPKARVKELIQRFTCNHKGSDQLLCPSDQTPAHQSTPGHRNRLLPYLRACGLTAANSNKIIERRRGPAPGRSAAAATATMSRLWRQASRYHTPSIRTKELPEKFFD